MNGFDEKLAGDFLGNGCCPITGHSSKPIFGSPAGHGRQTRQTRQTRRTTAQSRFSVSDTARNPITDHSPKSGFGFGPQPRVGFRFRTTTQSRFTILTAAQNPITDHSPKSGFGFGPQCKIGFRFQPWPAMASSACQKWHEPVWEGSVWPYLDGKDVKILKNGLSKIWVQRNAQKLSKTIFTVFTASKRSVRRPP